MNKGWLRRVLILVAAAAVCLALGLSARKQEVQTVSLRLWYAETDCAPSQMAAILERCRRETGLRIEARGFSDEYALGDALESEQPDLLFCNHIRAASLYAREKLGSLAQQRPFSPSLRTAGEGIGTSFFPLGGRLPLLVTNTALTDGDFDSLEALLEEAGETPFLVSDDWAELLFTLSLSKGCWMQGVETEDAKNPVYREVYNAVAEAVFRGGLVPTEQALAYVRQGQVPCAVVPSTELAGLTEEGLAVRLLPLPEGGEALYPAELMGFALLKDANTVLAGDFLDWLYAGIQDSETALALGLLPINTGAPGQSAAERALTEFAQSGLVAFLAPDTAFYANRAECEKHLRQALDLIA